MTVPYMPLFFTDPKVGTVLVKNKLSLDDGIGICPEDPITIADELFFFFYGSQ